jgi:hypothetical protein
MLVETPVTLGVQEEVLLQFRLPDGAPLLRGRARVVRLAGANQYGLEFTDLEPDASPRIRHFLETLVTN